MLENYTKQLRQHPFLATLQFEHWPEVLQEAVNWGLISPDPKIPRFLRLQPIFPYFLRNRLYAQEKREMRSAVETAFREHYDRVGVMLYQLFNSNEPLERQVGQVITELEYENLVTTLNLALAAQVAIHNPYFAPSRYLDTTQDQHRGLQLGQIVLNSLETYPPEKLEGQLGFEFARVIGDVANRQLKLKLYEEAEMSYQKVLNLLSQLEYPDKKESGRLKAGIYHQLGIVAQEQRQWKEASKYFLQSLEIDANYNDTYNMHIDLRSLARLWKASDDAKLPAAVAPIMGASEEEIEKLLREMLVEE
jgi:tetratricopeptide (TPR) repeat protein